MAAAALLAAALFSLAGCAAPAQTSVHAGRLGTVDLVPANSGTLVEGVSDDYWQWVADAASDRFAQPGAVPASLALPRHRVLALRDRLVRQRDGVLWIGHATFLVRLAGMTILTDPVFSERIAPLPGLGPRRYQPPALSVGELPAIDAVLVSHTHLDHLDELSLHALAQRFPDAKVIVPSGAEGFAAGAGFRLVRGARPGSEFVVGGVAIMALPTYHETSRAGFDAGLTPALSFSLRQRGGPSLFFSGDTGYGPLFRHVRRVLGRHDVALVGIGAYAPRSSVAHVHVTPEEAVRIARDLGAKHAVAMHWGTFPLSTEPAMEPAARFRRAGPDIARVLGIGGVLVPAR